MSAFPCRLAIAFALTDAGGPQLAALAGKTGLLPTEAIGSLLLPALYSGKGTGTDADYDALAAGRNIAALMARFPDLLVRWQQMQRGIVADVAQTLLADGDRTALLDHFAGNHFAATDIAHLLPDAVAVIVVPHPLQLLATAYLASDCDTARLLDAETRYRDLTLGPALIAGAIDAFRARALVLGQHQLGQAQTGQALADFLSTGHATAPATDDCLALPDHLFLDGAFNTLVEHYLGHLADVLPRLGYDAPTLQATWLHLRTQVLLQPLLPELDLPRFEAIGIDPATVAETIAAHLQPDGPICIPSAARQDLARLANAAGEGLFGADQTALAEDAIRLAVDIDPDCQTALNNLGVLAWHQGDAREAADRFLQAYRLEPSNRTTLDNLVSALTALGDTEQAKAMLLHYITLHPEDDEALAEYLQR